VVGPTYLHQLLVVLQVHPDELVKFKAAMASVPQFDFKELSNEVRSVFDQFIQ
jgi:hypothetical protein